MAKRSYLDLDDFVPQRKGDYCFTADHLDLTTAAPVTTAASPATSPASTVPQNQLRLKQPHLDDFVPQRKGDYFLKPDHLDLTTAAPATKAASPATSPATTVQQHRLRLKQPHCDYMNISCDYNNTTCDYSRTCDIYSYNDNPSLVPPSLLATAARKNGHPVFRA